MNNDGFSNLIRPTHGLPVSKSPFVYFHQRGNTFTDIRRTSHIVQARELDTRDWHGFASADYDGVDDLDVYVSPIKELRNVLTPQDTLSQCEGGILPPGNIAVKSI